MQSYIATKSKILVNPKAIRKGGTVGKKKMEKIVNK